MKKMIAAIALTVLSLTTVHAYANDVETTETVVEIEGEDYAKVDDIFCTVAMVNRRGGVIRRYHGTRSLRSFRCERPMRECRQDLRFRRVRFARCVELRN